MRQMQRGPTTSHRPARTALHPSVLAITTFLFLLLVVWIAFAVTTPRQGVSGLAPLTIAGRLSTLALAAWVAWDAWRRRATTGSIGSVLVAVVSVGTLAALFWLFTLIARVAG